MVFIVFIKDIGDQIFFTGSNFWYSLISRNNISCFCFVLFLKQNHLIGSSCKACIIESVCVEVHVFIIENYISFSVFFADTESITAICRRYQHIIFCCCTEKWICTAFIGEIYLFIFIIYCIHICCSGWSKGKLCICQIQWYIIFCCKTAQVRIIVCYMCIHRHNFFFYTIYFCIIYICNLLICFRRNTCFMFFCHLVRPCISFISGKFYAKL